MEQRFLIVDDATKKLPYYLIGVGCYYNQMPKVREKGVPFYNWIQCYEGKGIFRIGKEEVIVAKGQGIMILPHIPVAYEPITDNWMVDWITFNGRDVKCLLETWEIDTCGIYSISDQFGLEKKIRSLLVHAKKKESNRYVSYKLYDILLDMCQGLQLDEHFTHLRTKLSPVLQYIEEQISHPIVLRDMAEIIHVTPEYLCVLFQQVIGKRPMVYVNEYRIAKAKAMLLSHKEKSIHAIGEEVGFSAASYFSAVFRKVEGITPGVYRKLYG